jgi:hypothetical protein
MCQNFASSKLKRETTTSASPWLLGQKELEVRGSLDNRPGPFTVFDHEFSNAPYNPLAGDTIVGPGLTAGSNLKLLE